MRFLFVSVYLVLEIIGIINGGNVPNHKRCNNESYGCQRKLKLHKRNTGSENYGNNGGNIRNDLEDNLQLIGTLDRIYNGYNAFYTNDKVETSTNDGSSMEDDGGDGNLQSDSDSHDSIPNNEETAESDTTSESVGSSSSLEGKSNLDLSEDNYTDSEKTGDSMPLPLLDTDTNNDRNNDFWRMFESNGIYMNTMGWGNMDKYRDDNNSSDDSMQSTGSLENDNDMFNLNDFKNLKDWRGDVANHNGNGWQNFGNMNRDNMNNNNTDMRGKTWQFWQSLRTGNVGNNYNTSNGRNFRMGVYGRMAYGNNWSDRQGTWNKDIGSRHPNLPFNRNNKWRNTARARHFGGENVRRNWINNGNSRNMLRTIVRKKDGKIGRTNSTENGEDFTHTESVEPYYSE